MTEEKLEDQPTPETMRFEYQMAQEMLRHYDLLNWTIGTILLGSVMVSTGAVLSKASIGWVACVGLPAISGVITTCWYLWFRRHAALYNLRNDVMQRLEFRLGMYHSLLTLEKDGNLAAEFGDSGFERAKEKSGHTSFKKTKLKKRNGDSGNGLPWPSGRKLALFVAGFLPLA